GPRGWRGEAIGRQQEARDASRERGSGCSRGGDVKGRGGGAVRIAGRSPEEGTFCWGGSAAVLLASTAGLAVVRRVHLADYDAGSERPGVAWAMLRGSARAAMGLLWLLVLAGLASEVRVAGGAETFRNSTEGLLEFSLGKFRYFKLHLFH
ncbi:hypothetical protein MC885_012055, partial [Smutsia gigantea]